MCVFHYCTKNSSCVQSMYLGGTCYNIQKLNFTPINLYRLQLSVALIVCAILLKLPYNFM